MHSPVLEKRLSRLMSLLPPVPKIGLDRYLDGVGGTPKGHRKSARPTSSAYFDLEKGEFRCFLWENFIGQEDDYSL